MLVNINGIGRVDCEPLAKLDDEMLIMYRSPSLNMTVPSLWYLTGLLEKTTSPTFNNVCHNRQKSRIR